jgi:hypothetical protein
MVVLEVATVRVQLDGQVERGHGSQLVSPTVQNTFAGRTAARRRSGQGGRRGNGRDGSTVAVETGRIAFVVVLIVQHNNWTLSIVVQEKSIKYIHPHGYNLSISKGINRERAT